DRVVRVPVDQAADRPAVGVVNHGLAGGVGIPGQVDQVTRRVNVRGTEGHVGVGEDFGEGVAGAGNGGELDRDQSDRIRVARRQADLVGVVGVRDRVVSIPVDEAADRPAVGVINHSRAGRVAIPGQGDQVTGGVEVRGAEGQVGVDVQRSLVGVIPVGRVI